LIFNLKKGDINQIFIGACSIGDFQTVNAIVTSIKNFNIDVTDNLGRSALRLAISNEKLEVNIKMVKMREKYL
jgi:hypothetical protein